mgnify:CR=1 FL=1
MKGSKRFSLGSADFIKIAKSFGLAGVGTAVAIGVGYVGNLESTQYAWLIPLATVGLNLFRKFATDTLEP